MPGRFDPKGRMTDNFRNGATLDDIYNGIRGITETIPDIDVPTATSLTIAGITRVQTIRQERLANGNNRALTLAEVAMQRALAITKQLSEVSIQQAGQAIAHGYALQIEDKK